MLIDFFQVITSFIPWGLAAVTVVIAGFAALIGLGQYFALSRKRTPHANHVSYKTPKRIAILIASKNGEKTIERTIQAAKSNNRIVFVVSDGSTDKTAMIAKQAGARVLALRKNIGKPSALYRAYKHFNLSKKFDAVAILDDDVLIERDFIAQSKRVMSSDVAIAVGRNLTDWPNTKKWNVWLAARAYSYWCYQITLRRVQSAINVMNCISGSNSLYRTQVLNQVLNDKTPYIVDDTFWTLETHRLQLGKISYAPRAKAWIQDPTSFGDWYKQNLRWMWGTFQGIIGHQIGGTFNRFHIAYIFLITEWVMYVLSGPICLWLIVQGGVDNIPRQLVLLMSGYMVWVIGAAIMLKRARLVFFLPAIVVVDFIFRYLMVHAAIKAFRQKTIKACVWDSPQRFDKRVSTV